MLAAEFNKQKPKHTVASILEITGWDTLVGKNLSNFDLTGADMRGADMRGADMRDAIMDKVSLLEEIDEWDGAILTDMQLVDKDKLLTAEMSAPIIRQRMESLGLWQTQSVDNDDQNLKL